MRRLPLLLGLFALAGLPASASADSVPKVANSEIQQFIQYYPKPYIGVKGMLDGIGDLVETCQAARDEPQVAAAFKKGVYTQALLAHSVADQFDKEVKAAIALKHRSSAYEDAGDRATLRTASSELEQAFAVRSAQSLHAAKAMAALQALNCEEATDEGAQAKALDSQYKKHFSRGSKALVQLRH